jgi:hypothetical protein
MFNRMEANMMAASTKSMSMRGAQQWRECIDRQTASGKSVAAFCREHDIAPQTFYWWRKRLAKPAADAIAKVAAPAPFLDLGAIAAATPASGMLSIRLDLPGGITLTIARS